MFTTSIAVAGVSLVSLGMRFARAAAPANPYRETLTQGLEDPGNGLDSGGKGKGAPSKSDVANVAKSLTSTADSLGKSKPPSQLKSAMSDYSSQLKALGSALKSAGTDEKKLAVAMTGFSLNKKVQTDIATMAKWQVANCHK